MNKIKPNLEMARELLLEKRNVVQIYCSQQSMF